MQQEHGNHAEKSGMERSSTAGAVLWVWLFTAFPFVLQAAEVGAHLVGQAGEAVEELGVVPEHLVVLGFLVDDVVVHLAPALLEEGAALDLDVVAPVFDDVVQGAVDAVGNDLQLPAVVDAGVAGTLVGPGPFRQIVVARVLVEVPEPVPEVEPGVVFKAARQILMEMPPVLPVQEEHPDAHQVRDELVEIGVIQSGKFHGVLPAFADDLLQELGHALGAVAVGVDACRIDVVEVFVDEGFADLPQVLLDALVGLLDPQKLHPGDVCLHEIFVAEVELSEECTLVHDLTPKIECPESGFFPVLYPKTVLFATASKDGKV